jgi:hypothetical protein
MKQTKEEIMQIAGKEYYQVVQQELTTLDNQTKSFNQFKEVHKKLHKTFQLEYHNILSEIKELSNQLTQNKQNLLKTLQEQKQIITQKQSNLAQNLEINLASHKAEYEEELTKFKTKIKETKRQYEKHVKELQKALENHLDISAKNTLSIKEKGSQDDASFRNRLLELKQKHEEVIKELEKRKETKIKQLNESFKQKQETIKRLIEQEQEKYDKELRMKEELHQEELEEIEEKVQFDKFEYEQKTKAIHESLEKRIAVRKKHLERAIKDNDKRSIKLHKKDIVAFEREAKRDLKILQKEFELINEKNASYKKTVQDEFRLKRYELQKHFEEIIEEKRFALELEQSLLDNTLKQANLEYRKLVLKEQENYFELNSKILEKQETANMQRHIALEQELFNQDREKVKFNYEQKIAKLQLELAQEEIDMTLKQKEQELNYKIDLSQIQTDKTMEELSKAMLLAELEEESNRIIADKEFEIEVLKRKYKQEQLIPPSVRSNLLATKPLFESLYQSLNDQFDVENKVRLQRAVIMFDSLIKGLEKKHQEALKQINKFFDPDIKQLSDEIQSLCGDLATEYDQLISSESERFNNWEQKIASITGKKEKKDEELKYEKEYVAFEEKQSELRAQIDILAGPQMKLVAELTLAKQEAIDETTKQFESAKTRLLDAKELMQKQIEESESLLKQLSLKGVEDCEDFLAKITSKTDERVNTMQKKLDEYLDIYQTELENLKQQNLHKRAEIENATIAKLAELQNKQEQLENRYHDQLNLITESFKQYESQWNERYKGLQLDWSNQISEREKQLEEKKVDLMSSLNQAIDSIRTKLNMQLQEIEQEVHNIEQIENNNENEMKNKEQKIRKASSERLKKRLEELKTTS